MIRRELVKATLEFRNYNDRAPKQLWFLPWAEQNYNEELQQIQQKHRDDIVIAPFPLLAPSYSKGDLYALGESNDDWGCKFFNIQPGIIGEVKEPLVKDDDWDDVDNIHIPVELLNFDVEKVNQFCNTTDQFVLAGCLPRPFEQLQFIRTTEELFVDLVDPPKKLLDFMDRMHAFYCKLLEKWAQTEIDGIFFMDDWGSQNTLLINPKMWEKYFKPMYKDYIDIAKKYGKKSFMHSDGNILYIYPHLIEIGLDAVNSQLFCMGLENLIPFKGKITFWGEIDRQHILSTGSTEDVQKAVQDVYSALWSNGGCIAQCEFGPGANPLNVKTVFDTWSSIV